MHVKAKVYGYAQVLEVHAEAQDDWSANLKVGGGRHRRQLRAARLQELLGDADALHPAVEVDLRISGGQLRLHRAQLADALLDEQREERQRVGLLLLKARLFGTRVRVSAKCKLTLPLGLLLLIACLLGTRSGVHSSGSGGASTRIGICVYEASLSSKLPSFVYLVLE